MESYYAQLLEIHRIGEDKLWIDWQIPNPLALPRGWNLLYPSPVFFFDNEPWSFRIWPKWDIEEQGPAFYGTKSLASLWVKLDVGRLIVRAQPKTYCVRIGIRGSEGVEKVRGMEGLLFGGCSYECNDFCSRSELIEHKTTLMPDDVLTVACFLERMPDTAKAG